MTWTGRLLAGCLGLCGLAGMAAMPALAQDRFVDDLGRAVAMPEAPQRIVSLDDLRITVPLLELGVVPIGSHGRLGAGGTPYVRGGALLTGLDFEATDMAFLGAHPVDVERLAALAPDLILAPPHQPVPVAQLAAIAPTVVLDAAVRPPAALYATLARLTDRQAQAEALERRYRAQLAQLRHWVDPSEIAVSVITATADGKIGLERTPGSLGTVLRDAGFRFVPLIDDLPTDRTVTVSPEFLRDLDATYVFDTYRNDRGEPPDAARRRMAAAVPGFCTFLVACREGRYIILPRDETKAVSYHGKSIVIALLTGIFAAAAAAAP